MIEANIRRLRAPRQRAKRENPASGQSGWGLGLAKVVAINPEEDRVTLRILQGDEPTVREPVSVVWSGGGERSLLGVMPDVGDLCIVGWMAQESGGGSKYPVILRTIQSATWQGYGWLPTQDVGPEEYDLDSLGERDRLAGSYGRLRHLRQHLAPGNGILQSSQGSSVRVDESVTLAGRKGMELGLRDQDESLWSRSILRHHSEAGVVSRSGPVDRSALLLSRLVVGDGVAWDSSRQQDDTGLFLSPDGTESDLASGSLESGVPSGQYRPSSLFDGKLRADGINPLEFLRDGGVLDQNGNLLSGRLSEAVSAGKPLYRVSTDSRNSAAFQIPTLVENSRSIRHTTDQTLPVNDQTDGSPIDGLLDRPYLDVYEGTAVGVDPTNATLYGVPLSLRVFDGVNQTPSVSSAIGRGLAEQMATLTTLTPPDGIDARTASWGVTKAGTFRSYLTGQRTSLEVLLERDGRVESKGSLGLRARDIGLSTSRNLSLESRLLSIRSAALRVKTNEVGVEVDSLTGTVNNLNLISRQFRVGSTGSITLNAADAIQQQSNIRTVVTSGSARYFHGGPDQGSPATGPLRTTQFGGSPVSGVASTKVVDLTDIPVGTQHLRIQSGSSRTTIEQGDREVEITLGAHRVKAGPNQTTLDSQQGSGTNLSVGDHTVTVSAGMSNQSASALWSASTQGVATLEGSAGVVLRGPGKIGGIVCGADLDPLSGLPLVALGLGSPGHNLG